MLEQKKYFWLTALCLTSILLLAFFLRSYRIADIPAGLYPDEATNATDAIRAIETGEYKLFYPNNYGREGLFINLQAIALQIFGYTVPVLKLWSVVFGTLTVLGIYLLGAELFRRRVTGLIAAFFAATSFWAINFSRIGFRAIMMSLLVSFSFYFFFRGLRTKSYVSFALGGFLLGLGLHTYIAFRLTPAILILLLPALFLSYEYFFRRYWKQGLTYIFSAFVAAAPMLYHFFVSHPEDFASRTGAVSIFSPEINKGDFWGTLGKTVSLSLGKYNFYGDQNWRHNYPPYPILDPFSGTFFLAGFLFSLARLVSLLRKRFHNHDREIELPAYAFLFASFFVMLLPEFLTEEGLPHALRAIGTQTPVFLLSAIPGVWLLDKARRSPAGTKIVLGSLVGVFLFSSALVNISKYFVFFAQRPEQHGAFNENYTNISRYLLALPETTHKYVFTNAGGTRIDNGLPVTAQPILFLTYRKLQNIEYVTPEQTFPPLRRPAVAILQHHDGEIIRHYEQIYPSLRTEKIDPHPGLGGDFIALILP